MRYIICVHQLVAWGICRGTPGPGVAKFPWPWDSILLSPITAPHWVASCDFQSCNCQNIAGRFSCHTLDPCKVRIIIPDLRIFVATYGTELKRSNCWNAHWHHANMRDGDTVTLGPVILCIVTTALQWAPAGWRQIPAAVGGQFNSWDLPINPCWVAHWYNPTYDWKVSKESHSVPYDFHLPFDALSSQLCGYSLEIAFQQQAVFR